MVIVRVLEARYYSISSSPKADADRIAVTAVVTRYSIDDRHIEGVCTHYLLAKGDGESVPIFVRKSALRLPHRLTTPVIMIGPGTGFAPFRGFIQERSWHKQQGQSLEGDSASRIGHRKPNAREGGSVFGNTPWRVM